MKKSLLALAMLTMLGTLAAANGPANAQQNGPYYATPSWDQHIRRRERFILLWSDAAVLDRETGLVWERSPGTRYPEQSTTWTGALVGCRHTKAGDRAGWRLPSVEELGSVFDFSLDTNVGTPFQGLAGGQYWTATTSEDDPQAAWVLFTGILGYGSGNFLKDQAVAGAWCVRGGSSVSNPY
jgi:hypothetical protein